LTGKWLLSERCSLARQSSRSREAGPQAKTNERDNKETDGDRSTQAMGRVPQSAKT
jgi:hypothetical protein